VTASAPKDYSMSGYIYIGYDEKGLFKIGMTNNPQRREKEIRNMNPGFQFLSVIPHDKPAVAEAALHFRFARQREVGEWFYLAVEDIKYILDTYLPTEPPTIEDIRPHWKRAMGGERTG